MLQQLDASFWGCALRLAKAAKGSSGALRHHQVILAANLKLVKLSHMCLGS